MKKLLSLVILLAFTTIALAQVRISQVYGGGGNGGATYRNDFVELFNAGASAVDISGYTIQYASATGPTTPFNWASAGTFPVGTSIGGGKYFLVSLATGGAVGAFLPTVDFTGATTVNMAGSAGKVALVNTATILNGTTACSSATVVDVIGYGTATTTCSETSVFLPGTVSSVQAIFRKNGGCTESNNNSTDFEVLAVNPRNSASPQNPICGGGTPVLTPIPSSFTGISTVLGSPSAEFTYSISGSFLTAGPVIVTPSANLEISLAAGGPYTTGTLNITYTAPALGATSVYARIANTAPSGSFSGSVTNVGGGASATVTVSGSVLDAAPSIQAHDISFSAIANNGFDLNWTNGDGASRIVVVRPSSAPEVTPVNGTVYTVGNTLGSGNIVWYSGTGTGPVSVTGLTAGTSYTVRVYEYNGIAGTANYLTSTAVNNPATQTTTGVSPLLQQINFTGISVPSFMAPNAGRLPVMFYATVNNLLPNTAYRYFILGSASTDIGGTTTAGIPIMIDYNNGSTIYYESSASIASATAGQYGTFTTNASGSFSGSFGFTASSNARFNAGNNVYPAISLGVDNGTSTVVTLRFQLNQFITVLAYGTTSTTGTYIRGTSSANPKNLIALYKSQDGSSLLAGRPLYVTIAENASVAGGGGWGNANFVTGYNIANGTWNALIPNDNTAGVRLIQQIDLANGSVIGCSSDDDGTWSPGTVVTSNPSGGTTPVLLTSAEAPLTGAACFSILAVNLNNFTAIKKGNTAKLNWATAQEVNSSSFDVLRSTDGVNWKTVATVVAAGNSNIARNYEAYDNAPASGKNLYRLRSIDADGRSTLSDIRTLVFSDRFEVTVSPNPVKDVININISKKGNNPVQITLINNTGAVVGKYMTNSTAYSINAAGLNKGLYILKIISEDITTTEKIIIQ